MNKKHIFILFPLFLLIMLIGLYQFNRQRSPGKIVMIPKSADPKFEFWQTVKEGAEIAAKEEGVLFEFRGPREEGDIEDQKRIMRETILEKPDIIILAACDEDDLVFLCEEAAEQGIRVFTVDSDINSDVPISFVASDNTEASEVLGHYVSNTIGKEGEVVIVNFVAGVSGSKEREKGFLKAFSAYPGIKIHPTKYTDGTNEHPYEVTKEMILYQYPNLGAIVGGNQKTLEGVARAVEELGLQDKITVAGLDSSLEIIHALEKDIVDAIVVQKPFNIGYISVESAIKEYRGEKLPKRIGTGHKLITKSTLNLLENQKLLYPITK